jgi:Spy/CpxP family protein refolding chaperone
MIELQVEHARIKSEIMQILTADQKAKLAQLEANRAAHISKHAAPPPAN